MNKDIRILVLGLFLSVCVHPFIFSQSTFENFSAKTPIVLRLKTFSKQVAYLEKKNPKKAQEFRIEIKDEHQKYVKAFTNEFKERPIYFIYADSSILLLNGKVSGYFLDSTLMVNHNIQLTDTSFLIADYGEMDRDQFNIDALYLRDQKLRFPEKKFRYYVGRNDAPVIGTFLTAITFGLIKRQIREPALLVNMMKKDLDKESK